MYQTIIHHLQHRLWPCSRWLLNSRETHDEATSSNSNLTVQLISQDRATEPPTLQAEALPLALIMFHRQAAISSSNLPSNQIVTLEVLVATSVESRALISSNSSYSLKRHQRASRAVNQPQPPQPLKVSRYSTNQLRWPLLLQMDSNSPLCSSNRWQPSHPSQQQPLANKWLLALNCSLSSKLLPQPLYPQQVAFTNQR